MSLKKNILITCEYGYGRRHLYRLLQLRTLYNKHGYKVFLYYYHLNDIANFISSGNDNSNIYATPLPNPQVHNLKITSYGDILTAFDIYEKDSLKSHLAAWMKILNEIKPSLVICENAPILNLITSSKIPTISLGDGISMLPFADFKFPMLREDTFFNFKGEKAINSINDALKIFCLPPLKKLGNIWNQQFTFITHRAELDIYRHYRPHDQHYYSLYPDIIKKINDQEKKIFCYLYPDYQNFDAILIALVEHKFYGTALIPRATKKVVQFLEYHNIKVYQNFNFLKNRIDMDVNLILHHGGIELAQYGLQQGISQIIFPKSINNFLIAGYLNNNKYGLKVNNKWLGIHEVGDLISSYWMQRKINHKPINIESKIPRGFNEFKNRMLSFAENGTS